MKKVQKMANYLKYPREIATALNNLGDITSFQYKNFFIVPKVKVQWRSSQIGNSKRRHGGLYFSINGKPVRGWIMFDHPHFFKTKAETQHWLNGWLSERLTRTINSIEPDTSKTRDSAKHVVEKTYNVKVK